MHLDAVCGIEADSRQHQLLDREGRKPRLGLLEHGEGYVERLGRSLCLGIQLLSHHVAQRLLTIEHPESVDRGLHGHRIEVVHVDFHVQCLGIIVRRSNYTGQWMVFAAQQVHRTEQVNAVVVTLHEPHGNRVSRIARRRDGG